VLGIASSEIIVEVPDERAEVVAQDIEVDQRDPDQNRGIQAQEARRYPEKLGTDLNT